MAINEVLKFSWGHIIAFVALIFISYVTFMGIAYLADGNFVYAGVGVVAIDVLMLLFFIVPQLLKGTERKFSKCIVWERILIILSPFAFVVLMYPYSHFWSVFSERDNIQTEFSRSISSTKQMFLSYEGYAGERISNYEKKLKQAGTERIHRENKVEALRLQLLDANYTDLKNSALKWIDRASGATVWNVFMIGNIDKVESALDSWNSVLVKFSDKRMSDESGAVKPFSTSDPSVVAAKKGLQVVRTTYREAHGLSLITLVSGIILYLMLLFPYILQRRHTKSIYILLGKKKRSTSDIGVAESSVDDSDRKSRERKPKSGADEKTDDDIRIPQTKEDSADSDEYGAFTL